MKVLAVWKWKHYCDVYHRHFSKFVGREVHVLEVGIYSGGSLQMWREYFGRVRWRLRRWISTRRVAAYADDEDKDFHR